VKAKIKKLYGSNKSPLLLGYLLLVSSYLPGVLRTSLYSDDFPAIIETPSTALTLVSDTRPIWGLGMFLFFSLAKFTGLYIIPKVVGFIGLILLYRYTCGLFRNSKHQSIHYFIIAIGFLLPSFGIWSHWSTSLFHSWCALLALVAHEKFKLESRKISVLMMSVSCLIYPPATVFFFGVIFYRTIAMNRTNSELLSDFLSALKLLLLAGSLSLLFAFSTIRVLGLNPTSRVSIIGFEEFPNKIIWFFSHPFALGFFPMSVHSPSWFQLLSVGVPISLAILFVSIKGIKLSRLQVMFRFILLFLLIVLSISPLLISKDNQIELRLTPGISWAILCTSLFGIYRLLEIYLNSFRRLISGILSLSLISFTFFGVTQRFQDFYLHQDKFSTEFIIESIHACEQSGKISGITIRDNKTEFPVLPYLGTFSMTSDMASVWVPQNKTIFVLQRHFPEYSKVPVLMNSDNPKFCTIDLDDFVKGVISSERKTLL
jgi:hypothetical protein